MKYTATVEIPQSEVSKMEHYLNHEPKTEDECLSEDEKFSYTATFENGYEMDIEVCGVQFEEAKEDSGVSNTAWSQAVLFNKGAEVSCSDVSDTILGKWELEDSKGNTYVAEVVAIPD